MTRCASQEARNLSHCGFNLKFALKQSEMSKKVSIDNVSDVDKYVWDGTQLRFRGGFFLFISNFYSRKTTFLYIE